MALTKVTNSMIVGAPFNVLDYGADPTYSTSSSAAIQSAVNAANAAGGGIVYIPAGTYKIDAVITLKSFVSVCGTGPATQLLMLGNNAHCFDGDDVTNIDIYDLFINGQKPNVGWETTNNYDFGIRLGNSGASQGTKYINIYNCTFKNIGLDGINIENSFAVNISNCNFINCRRWGVAATGGTYSVTLLNVSNSLFDCNYPTGPLGKEYPLGAIDIEPNGAEVVENCNLTNLNSYHGDIWMVVQSSNPAGLSISDCNIYEAKLQLSNTGVSVSNVRLDGTVARLLDDTLIDSVPSYTTYSNVVINNSRLQTLSTGNTNLLPISYGNVNAASVKNQSGTGLVGVNVTQNIDGIAVPISPLSAGAGTGIASGTWNAVATVNTDDQIFIYVEVERTDSNIATGNFFNVTFANINATIQLRKGITGLTFASSSDAGYANADFTVGLSGTPGVAVAVNIRKMFLFVNPTRIDMAQFRVYA